MADDGDNIFVYLGGEQVVPEDVTRVIIDRSVKIIPRRAFFRRYKLVSAEMHDGVEKIDEGAFRGCHYLRRIKFPGVREIEYEAFLGCNSLTDVEFGNNLETIGFSAFHNCRSIQRIQVSSVKTISFFAFHGCGQLMDAEFGDKLETIEHFAFGSCVNLQRIAIPLKDNMFPIDTMRQQYTQFDRCENLTIVDLVGVERIRNTISSLLLESWRNEMLQEIGRF
jgi:hypothetical protein